MSDYMFMLENHLTAAQSDVLAHVRTAAAAAGLNLFLAGGPIRDMLAGLPVREMTFVVEGDASQVARQIVETGLAQQRAFDPIRNTSELLFESGVVVEIGMARHEKYPEAGAAPEVSPATIHEHLGQRDFTVNALALSLNRASRGLIIDPTNGAGDLERRELRALSNFGLYDHPIRLFRLFRFQVRLGFTVAERTQRQYQNAREAEVEKLITPADLAGELRLLSLETGIADVLKLWNTERLLSLVSPALSGPGLSLAAFQKLQKTRALIPFGAPFVCDDASLFFYLLLQKLTPKERATIQKSLAMQKGECDAIARVDAAAAKLDRELSAGGLTKPSTVYARLARASGEHILLTAVRTTNRASADRIKNYFQKYLPLALEITDEDVRATGEVPGSVKGEKKRSELIARRLDARPKKVADATMAVPMTAM